MRAFGGVCLSAWMGLGSTERRNNERAVAAYLSDDFVDPMPRSKVGNLMKGRPLSDFSHAEQQQFCNWVCKGLKVSKGQLFASGQDSDWPSFTSGKVPNAPVAAIGASGINRPNVGRKLSVRYLPQPSLDGRSAGPPLRSRDQTCGGSGTTLNHRQNLDCVRAAISCSDRLDR